MLSYQYTVWTAVPTPARIDKLPVSSSEICSPNSYPSASLRTQVAERKPAFPPVLPCSNDNYDEDEATSQPEVDQKTPIAVFSSTTDPEDALATHFPAKKKVKNLRPKKNCESQVPLKKLRKSQQVPRLEKLPADFEPSHLDVLCGKGKRVTENMGYRRFIGIVRKNMPAYNEAPNKSEKSQIVNQILDETLSILPDGGFVKQDEEGIWYRLGEYARREKVGQILRDMLHTKYKSSNTVKNRKRKDLFTTMPEDLSEENVALGVALAKRRRLDSQSSDGSTVEDDDD